MPAIEITDEQHERFAAVREELAAAHAGEYASVQPTDVMAYLLDLAETADNPGAVADGDVEAIDRKPTENVEQEDDEEQAEMAGDDVDSDNDTDENGSSGAPAGPGMLNILEDHDEKWREADGDARYEVDLPDGGTETARTRDDVKVILFKHHQ